MKTHFQVTFPQEPGASFPIAASNGRTLPVRARPDVRPNNIPTRLLTREEWDDLRRPAGPYLAAYQPKRPVPDVDFEAEDGTLWTTAEACLEHELEVRFGVKTLAEVEAAFEVQQLLLKEYEKKWVSITTDAGTQRHSLKEMIQEGFGPMPKIQKMAEGHGNYAQEIQDRFGVETLAEVEAQMKAIADKAKLTVGDCQDALYDAKGNPPFSGVPSNDSNDATPDEAARLLASALSRRGLKIAEAAQATGLTSAQVRSTAKSLPGQFAMKGGRVFLVG